MIGNPITRRNSDMPTNALNRRRTLKSNAKLSDQDVILARKRYFSGLATTRDLAIEHDVGMETMRRALRGDTFAHLYHDNAPQIGTVNPIDEPTEEEQAAALRRLMAVQEEVKRAAPPDANELIEAMTKGRSDTVAALEKFKKDHPGELAQGDGGPPTSPLDE